MHAYMGYQTCYYRTFVCGKPNRYQIEAYETASRWLSDAVDVIKPGVTTAQLNARAEAIIRALERGSASARDLASYTKAWKRSTGRMNEAFFHAARIFYAFPDEELSRVVRELARSKGVIGEKGINPRKMMRALVVSHPGLLVQWLASRLGAHRARQEVHRYVESAASALEPLGSLGLKLADLARTYTSVTMERVAVV